MSVLTSHHAPPSKAVAQSAERRTQVRVRVEIPIKVVVRGMDEPLAGMTQDLSWGGVLFLLPAPLAPSTRVARILLPWKRQEQINTLATILRSKVLQDGRVMVAARFVSLSPRSQARLERLLGMLRNTTSVDRSGPTELVRELEIQVNDVVELRHIMEGIASGTHTLTVFDAYDIGQSLCFSLAATEDWAGIRLRARVVGVMPLAMQGFDGVSLYSLTLQFEHPRESIERLVQFLLGQLAETADVSVLMDWSQLAPPWLGRAQVQTPQPPPPPSRPMTPIQSSLRCTLEVDFPEALNYLTLGWGDVAAFEMLFRELTMGDRVHSGSWPPEAWQELSLLQDVHDLAYGISSERRTFLKYGST